jgi:hypothetical protein
MKSSSSSDLFFKRYRLWKRQYLHVVIYTSLFWIFVDVFVIMLFSDCTKQIIVPCSSSLKENEIDKLQLNDNDLPIRHPKFNRIKGRNETILNKKYFIIRKKVNKDLLQNGLDRIQV